MWQSFHAVEDHWPSSRQVATCFLTLRFRLAQRGACPKKYRRMMVDAKELDPTWMLTRGARLVICYDVIQSEVPMASCYAQGLSICKTGHRWSARHEANNSATTRRQQHRDHLSQITVFFFFLFGHDARGLEC